MSLERHVLTALLALCLALPAAGCAGTGEGASAGTAASGSSYTTLVDDFRDIDVGLGRRHVSRMELSWARCFTIDSFEGGYDLACMADGNRYLIVDEGADVPQGLSEDVQVIRRPLRDIYLAASDSMCLFDALGAVDRVSVSGIERDDWSIEAAREAMDAGAIVFGGKYRAPDYELLLSRGVTLAFESTMINHTPDVREKLIELGIPVLVELSSYESEPLGRLEWIRLLGVLLGERERADAAFEEQVATIEGIERPQAGQTVAFFYLNGNGDAVVRRPGDYVTRMIELAGGTYAFSDLEAATMGSSTLTMQMERFFATARDADLIVYNATVGDAPTSVGELCDRCALLADCKAVREGRVFVTDADMYQQMTRTADVVSDLARAIGGTTDGLTYLRRLS